MVQNNLGDSLSNTIERILTANELSVIPITGFAPVWLFNLSCKMSLDVGRLCRKLLIIPN